MTTKEDVKGNHIRFTPNLTGYYTISIANESSDDVDIYFLDSYGNRWIFNVIPMGEDHTVLLESDRTYFFYFDCVNSNPGTYGIKVTKEESTLVAKLSEDAKVIYGDTLFGSWDMDDSGHYAYHWNVDYFTQNLTIYYQYKEEMRIADVDMNAVSLTFEDAVPQPGMTLKGTIEYQGQSATILIPVYSFTEVYPDTPELIDKLPIMAFPYRLETSIFTYTPKESSEVSFSPASTQATLNLMIVVLDGWDVVYANVGSSVENPLEVGKTYL